MYVIEVEVQFGGQVWSVYVDCTAPDAFDYAIAQARKTLTAREAHWATLVIA